MRRLATLSFGAALLALPTLAHAQLAPGEVDLHIEATASIPPDRATLSLTLNGRGEAQSAARAEIADKYKKLAGELEKLGIAASKLKQLSSTDTSQNSFTKITTVPIVAPPVIAVPAPSDARALPPKAALPAPPRMMETASATYSLELDDPSKLPAIEAMVAREGLSYGRIRPAYQTLDPDKARAQARSDALAKARSEADAYAAALGYRVVRLVRVSNARPAFNFRDLIGFAEGMESRNGSSGLLNGSTFESVALDFVMTPK